MTDEKRGKQATLGYVKDGQQTIGCVAALYWRKRPFVPTVLVFIFGSLG
jgi:DNA ligase-1